jgi:hypothetical protein
MLFENDFGREIIDSVKILQHSSNAGWNYLLEEGNR